MAVKRSQPNHDADASPKKSRAGCVWACIALVFCLVLLCGGVWVCLFVDIPLEISEETTYITEPLTADGTKVDYFAALELEYYPEGMKSDDNGYRLVVKNLGDLADYSDEEGYPLQGVDLAECRAQTLQKLGLEPNDIRRLALKFQAPYDFLEEYFAGEEFDEALVKKLLSEDASEDWHLVTAMEIGSSSALNYKLDSPWTLDDLPMMARWLEENGPVLDLIAQAVRRPSFCVPMIRIKETEPLIVSRLSADARLTVEFARAFRTRANHRVARGDIDGAIKDILTCKRLGRHVGRGGAGINSLIGTTMERMASLVGIAASPEHQPTEAQFQRLWDEWEDGPPRMSVNEFMLAERYFALDIVQGIAHGDYSLDDLCDEMPELSGEMLEFVNVLARDWNVVAKRMNEHYDNLEKGIEFQGLDLRSSNNLLLSGHRSRIFADVLGCSLLPFLEMHSAAQLGCAECCDNLHRITLAMLIYERRNGTLPPAYTVDAAGAPLHSWRVVLLPYLGQQELHDKIRLDEPWDSQHNRQFHHEAVSFYQCPTAELDLGQTNYSVVVGPDMPFEASKGKSLADFGPQSGDMILVVERAGPVCWMDPTQEVPQAVAEQGINVNSDQFRSLGKPNDIASGHPGGAQFGRRDGAVRFLSGTMDVETLKKLLNGTNDSSI